MCETEWQTSQDDYSEYFGFFQENSSLFFVFVFSEKTPAFFFFHAGNWTDFQEKFLGEFLKLRYKQFSEDYHIITDETEKIKVLRKICSISFQVMNTGNNLDQT